MPSRNLQLVKWTLPAFALILGFFWYKRRRVDRVDPGGAAKLRVAANDKKRDRSTDARGHGNNLLNLYDSGIHIEDSYGSSSSREESHGTPRRVSKSLDIPGRRPSSQPISMKSGRSKDKIDSWYENIEDIEDSRSGIVYGSKPRATNFEMPSDPVRRDGKGSVGKRVEPVVCGENLGSESKIVKIFDKFAEEEEEEESAVVETIATVASSISLTENAAATTIENGCGNDVAENCSESVARPSADDSKLLQGRTICERDSANHSPVSGVLEGSVTDEARSEGSTDSGKGGSINGHGKEKNPTSYEFAIEQSLVGRLIGKRGAFLHEINAQAGVRVSVKRHPLSKDLKICLIIGTPDGIKTALKLIRQKFPPKKFPTVTLEEITILKNNEAFPWMSELTHLPIVEGVNNDVMVCHIVKPNRLFVQFPTHPTYPTLRALDENMTQLYDNIESPCVPDQLSKGMLVVAKWYERWVRVYIEEPDPNGQQNLVRLVDYGGYWTFSNADMRKIRADYLTLPFQSVEVFLAHIQPVDGEWKQEAYNVVAQMCTGCIGQAQVEGYIDSNIYVSLYYNVPKHGVISVADELIARGYAVPVTLENIAPEEHLSIA